ncbi:MAG: hypothetical protein OXB95_09565, partial [Rhodobacteraceae bacterium]|nr:hypothetical protein [Paracoccaceae bacterium]
MAIDFTGIVNGNEFYSDHYLGAGFANEVRTCIRDWSAAAEEGDLLPSQRLRLLAANHPRLVSDYRECADAAERVRMYRTFAAGLLDALGYERHVEQAIDSDETWLPLVSRCRRSD